MAKTFVEKWQGQTVVDGGGYVSKEYSRFQTALIKEIGRIAEIIGAKVVGKTKGFYFTSCFVERDGNFVYINHNSSLDRMGNYVKISLDNILIRTAENEKDFRGGNNQYCDFDHLRENMKRLLNH